MAKVVNIMGSSSNVGKTFVMEGLIKELKSRNYKIATIKHDVHGFDIDHENKDTYKHRKAGADTVVISSKNRFAMIKEVQEEISLPQIIRSIYKEYDIILVEGYKKSPLRKIEVFRKGISEKIITPKEKLICLASDDEKTDLADINIIDKNDFKSMANLIEKEEQFKINAEEF